MSDHMNHLPMPIEELRALVGYKSKSTFRKIIQGKVKPGALLAIRIEIESGGAIMRGDLRPDVWPCPF